MKRNFSGDSAAAERRATDLLSTTRRALWPLIKLLMQEGVGYPALAEAIREAFVLVALREFPPEGKRETDSRISLLTGIHRRDVKRLREQAQLRAARGASVSPGATQEIGLADRVLARWSTRPEYVDRRARPRPLPRHSSAPGEPSFEALVQAVSKDIRPRALLDEWLRRGVVTLDAQERVHLKRQLRQRSDADRPAAHLTQGVHDHLAAVVETLTNEVPLGLDRYIVSRGLTDASVAELAAAARTRTLRTLEAIGQRGKRLEARDAGKEDASRRVGLGVYLYCSAPKRREDIPPQPRAARPARGKR